MKRQLLTIGAAASLAFAASACIEQPPAPPGLPPASCGQTADGKAITFLAIDNERCPAQYPGQKRIIIAEECGPSMPGSLVADDCYRGNVPGRPSPDNFRYGTIVAAGGQVINFVASDATAA